MQVRWNELRDSGLDGEALNTFESFLWRYFAGGRSGLSAHFRAAGSTGATGTTVMVKAAHVRLCHSRMPTAGVY